MKLMSDGGKKKQEAVFLVVCIGRGHALTHGCEHLCMCLHICIFTCIQVHSKHCVKGSWRGLAIKNFWATSNFLSWYFLTAKALPCVLITREIEPFLELSEFAIYLRMFDWFRLCLILRCFAVKTKQNHWMSNISTTKAQQSQTKPWLAANIENRQWHLSNRWFSCGDLLAA